MSRKNHQPAAVRCAIYTRKSTEAGLEQDFNSLDAQREACLAYIQSQRHEGWKCLPQRYDDVDYWHHAFFPWQRWLGWSKKANVQAGYSARRLRRLFDGFVEHRVHKRQLRRSEVPHIWRFLPLSLLQRMFGRTLILKAFKPLSAISVQQMAA